MKKLPKRIEDLLRKVFTKMLEEPRILHGFYDISIKEAWFIEEEKKISLNVMETLAIDHYFERESELYDLTWEEASEVSGFLKTGSFEGRYKLLKPHFKFLIREFFEK